MRPIHLRLAAAACTAFLFAFGTVWAYGLAIPAVVAGALGLYLVRRASRADPRPGGTPWPDRLLAGGLVLGLAASLAAFVLTR